MTLHPSVTAGDRSIKLSVPLVTLLQIFDAKTMINTPVATVELPYRVPSGFHGLFVPQAELDTQDRDLKAPHWDAPFDAHTGSGSSKSKSHGQSKGATGSRTSAVQKSVGPGAGEAYRSKHAKRGVVFEAPEDAAQRRAVLWGTA